ncbi:hypothetical protein LCGC14_1149470 [marine sediment metagenome]|uniref:Uncharacterized protein n=1 Tax=marine sediment metagenome TaxID=412755 RepID=A0A0F9Q1M5_9ZZZZ
MATDPYSVIFHPIYSVALETVLVVAGAERLRAAAKATDAVLSNALAVTGCPLRVEAERLVVTTDRGPSTFYADLSQGERSRIAVDLAIEAVGEGGLIPLVQEFWEGLDPKNQRAIATAAREADVSILTAKATDGETVTAEVFAGE